MSPAQEELCRSALNAAGRTSRTLFPRGLDASATASSKYGGLEVKRRASGAPASDGTKIHTSPAVHPRDTRTSPRFGRTPGVFPKSTLRKRGRSWQQGSDRREALAIAPARSASPTSRIHSPAGYRSRTRSRAKRSCSSPTGITPGRLTIKARARSTCGARRGRRNIRRVDPSCRAHAACR
jgi:hypothetical protein